ncbi:MAG: hypothetical protein P8X84_02270, partial [Candidatus Bathyarchaeota archaeon]
MKKLHIRKLESLKTTAPGGIPLLHGLSGKEFGQAVKNVAHIHEYPRAVTDFIHQYKEHPEHPEISRVHSFSCPAGYLQGSLLTQIDPFAVH